MNMSRIRSRGLVAAILALSVAQVAAESADGVLDPTFGTDGITTVAFDIAAANPIDLALDAVVDSFGRTYLVGIVTTTDGQRIGITRLRTDGTLDTHYGPDDVGLVVAPEQLGFSLTGVSAALDPQGKLLVGGTLTTAGNDDFALCRFDIDGSLDAFSNGLQCVKVAFDLGGTNDDTMRDIAVQPDGKIVMAGSAGFSTELIEGAVARLDTNGDLDADFGTTGKQYFLPSGMDSIRLNAVAIQRNGRIVAVGDTNLDGDTDRDLLVARLNADGTMDTNFNADGVRAYFPVEGSRDHTFSDVELVPITGQLILDQSLIVSGSIETAIGSGLYDGMVARIDPTSDPNPGFGSNGFRVIGTGHDLELNDLQLEGTGRILVAGTIVGNANPATTMDFYISRLLPDGSTDVDGFSPPNGFSLVNVSGSNDIAHAIALQNDRIIVAGSSLTSAGPPANLDFSAIALLRDRIFANGFD